MTETIKPLYYNVFFTDKSLLLLQYNNILEKCPELNDAHSNYIKCYMSHITLLHYNNYTDELCAKINTIIGKKITVKLLGLCFDENISAYVVTLDDYDKYVYSKNPHITCYSQKNVSPISALDLIKNKQNYIEFPKPLEIIGIIGNKFA